MRLILIQTLIVCSGLLVAGPQQIVLLGKPDELIDLLQVELASNPELTPLSRAEITLLLREHQLATEKQAQLLRLFPHADLLAVFSQPTGKTVNLLLFNARNGFRLIDQTLPDNGLPQMVDYCARLVQEGSRKSQSATSRHLAINLVRHVAIDWQQMNALQNWLQLFARELLRHQDIQLLERDHLGQVQTERELTSQLFALTPSTRLLTFEFETEDARNVIKTTLCCHDLDGRERLRLTQSDILTDAQPTIARLVDKLRDGLADMPTPTPITNAAHQEAENFFLASKKTRNPQDTLTRIEAAVALAPGNETYRYAEILAHAEVCYFVNAEAMLAHAQQTFAVVGRFQEDFPEWQQPFFPESLLSRWCSFASLLEHVISDYAARNRNQEVQKFTTLQKQLAEFYACARPAVQLDYRRLPQHAFDFSDGLDNIEEARRFAQYFDFILNKYPLYAKPGECLRDGFAALQEYLHTLERVWQQNPKMAQALENLPINWNKMLQKDNDRHAFQDFFQADNNILPFLDKLSLPAGRLLAAELRLVLGLLQSQPQQDRAKSIYAEYYAGMAAANPACFHNLKSWRQKLNLAPYTLLNRVCYQLPNNFAWVCLEEFLGQTPPDTPLDRLENLLQQPLTDNNLQVALEVAEQLSALGGDCLRQHRVANAFRDLSFLTWERKQPDLPEHLQFLRPSQKQKLLLCSLNRHFILRHGRFDKALAYPKPLLCLASCRDGDGVLLLLGGAGQQRQVSLARVNADGDMSMLPTRLLARQPFWFADFGEVRQGTLLCDKEHVWALVSGQGFLVKRQHEDRVLNFTDLLDPGNSQVLLAGRVYVLNETSLRSMNINGEQLKTHFSQSRLNGKLELEKSCQTRNLTASKNGDLYFLAAFPEPGKNRDREELWRFDPRQEIFALTTKLPAGKKHALREGESLPLLLSLDRRRTTIFQLESISGELRELARLPDKDKFRLARFHRSGSDTSGPRPFPFLLQGNHLWVGGLNPACVNLQQPRESPLLWLPQTDKVFPLKNGVLFLRHNYWFRLKLNQTGATE